jgi:hypothetical protein
MTLFMKRHYPSPKVRLRLAALSLIASLPLLCCSAQSHAQLPPNLDFGMGNFSNWRCWVGYSTTGTAATGAAFSSPALSAPIGGNVPGPGIINKSRHAITTGSDTDYYGGFHIVCPAGGTFSMRLGNDSPGARADRIQYLVHVPATAPSYNIQVQYAAVMQDAAHSPSGQSTFQVMAYDSATGAVIPAANNLYIARYAIPGFSPFNNPATGQVDSTIAWLPWTPSTINLSGMGGKTVVIECTVLDCAYGGHWAYGYFDVVSAADSLMASLLRYTPNGDSAVLEGPPGYKSYRWYNQDFSIAFNGASDPARTLTLPAPASPQYYNLVITPYASVGVADTIRTPLLRIGNVGVSHSAAAAAQVYPNPATSLLHVSFAAPFDGTLTISNAAGATVYSKQLSKSRSLDIPTDGLATGIYSLVLTDRREGTSTVRQIAVRR